MNLTFLFDRIFIGGKHLGGFDELEFALKNGTLFGYLTTENVKMTNAVQNVRPTEVASIRKDITPNPYVEESLAMRNILKDNGPLVLPSVVENLYTLEIDGTFTFNYTECNKPYSMKPDDTKPRIRNQEPERCKRTANAILKLPLKPEPRFQLNLILENTDMWGMRFVGRIIVEHVSGEVSAIYLPGVLTFDPAGISGDSHSSERIGPSCARIQTGVTIAQLFAMQNGCTSEDVDAIQDASGINRLICCQFVT